ncbi:VQ motif-containing protein [Fagus crenata]
MDSGNSGSMQSSSGGDEEYDSRAESVPAFLNNPPSNHFGSMSNPPSLFPQHQNQHQPNLSDLSSNYFQAFSQSQAYSNPNSMLHLDHAVQPRGLRSDQPNCTDLGNLPGSSSSTQHHGPNQGSTPTARATTQPNVVRNSKKRTRASRRAPTTVLTTDTSNFRAMVQEFTGIPSPPFSGSSNSRRFDLFGNSSALRTGHLEPMGALYPLRPSPQKVQLSPFLSSSSSSCSSSSSSLLNNTMVDATNSNHFSSTLHNYHQVPLGQIPRQPQNMLNMQNPILTFQPLSQTSLHPSFNVPGFGARSLDELGMSHGHVNVNLCELPQPNHGNDGGQDHLRSSDSNFGNSLRVGGGCKLNYSATSSSDFNHDKPLENVSTRGEGTVDSWLCPSD